MNLSHQRLNEILYQLEHEGDMSNITREEWLSIATELRQLRLRTSAASRSAAAATGK